MTASRVLGARRAGVTFILITLFIDSLGFGLIIPILPKLVEQLVGGAISDASSAVGLLTSLYAVMQFFLPGAPFFMGGALFVVSIWLALRATSAPTVPTHVARLATT